MTAIISSTGSVVTGLAILRTVAALNICYLKEAIEGEIPNAYTFRPKAKRRNCQR